MMNNWYFLSSLLHSCGSDMVIISIITIHGCLYFPTLFLLAGLSISVSFVLIFTLATVFIPPCLSCNLYYLFMTCSSVLCTALN
jgi:hypothetical protein